MTHLVTLFTPRFFLYAAAPIVLDYGIFNLASSKMWKYGGSTAIGLGAVAVLSRYTFHIQLIAGIYAVYKALLVWSNISNISWGASKPGPSASTPTISMDQMRDSWLAGLRTPSSNTIESYAALHLNLRVVYPDPWTSWKDLNVFAAQPTTLQAVHEKWEQNWGKALELMQKAETEFEALLNDLLGKFESAPTEEEKHQQIVQFFIQFLQKDNSLRNTKFSSYADLYRNHPYNLLGYYRFIRSMSFMVEYQNSNGQRRCEIYTSRLTIKEKFAFAAVDTPQYKIRQIYNRAVEKWLPIMKYLPPDNPYRAWIQRDDMSEQFNLNPPPLPWD